MNRVNLIFICLGLITACAHKPKPENFEDLARSRSSELMPCLDDYLKENPKFKKGRMTIAWLVDDSKIPQEMYVIEPKSSITNPKFRHCVMGRLKTWEMPAAPSERFIKLEYPFEFVVR